MNCREVKTRKTWGIWWPRLILKTHAHDAHIIASWLISSSTFLLKISNSVAQLTYNSWKRLSSIWFELSIGTYELNLDYSQPINFVLILDSQLSRNHFLTAHFIFKLNPILQIMSCELYDIDNDWVLSKNCWDYASDLLTNIFLFYRDSTFFTNGFSHFHRNFFCLNVVLFFFHFKWVKSQSGLIFFTIYRKSIEKDQPIDYQPNDGSDSSNG